MKARHDPMTGEWFFKGKWYDHYPQDLIEDYEEHEIERYENEREEAKTNV